MSRLQNSEQTLLSFSHLNNVQSYSSGLIKQENREISPKQLFFNDIRIQDALQDPFSCILEVHFTFFLSTWSAVTFTF